MDPISAAAGIISIVDVVLRTTSAVVKYAQDTRHASQDRRLLAEETRILSKLLERLRDCAQTTRPDPKWLNDRKEIVLQFEGAHEDLANALGFDMSTNTLKESAFKSVRASAKWSLTKPEVYALLQRITRLQQYVNILLSDSQYAILERLDQKQQEVLDQEQRMLILTWLSPLQMTQVHQTFSNRAGEGSGKWLLMSDAFISWRKGTNKLLWCWGLPGAGKTVLASIIVNHLRRERDEHMKSRIGIAVIYLRYNDPEQTLDNLLGSLLRQLVQESDTIPSALLELYEHHRDRNTSPSSDEILEVLSSTIEVLEEVFFVIDGLDECNEGLRWELIEQLGKFQPNLHLLITSRYLDSIAEDLEDFKQFEVMANKADIELFIDHQILKNKNLRKIVKKSNSLRVDIKDAVIKTAEGMFLLARLHLESLASAASLSVKYVRNKLQTLPNTLTGTYDNAMQRIQDQEPEHKRVAFKTLAWLSYAFRSLSLGELQHALAIEPGDAGLDEELVMDGQSITSLCAGLVIVDQGTNVVNLVHYSTKSYFGDTRHKFFPNFHASITLSCATYLTLNALQNVPIGLMVQRYPLAYYAAQYLGDHARETPEEALDPSILEVICQLLSHPDKRKPLLSLLDGLDLITSGFYSSGKAEGGLDTVTEIPPADNVRMLFKKALDLSSDPLSMASAQGAQDSKELGDNDQSSRASTITGLDTDASTQSGDDDFQSSLHKADTWEARIRSSRIPEVTALHLAASMGLARVASMLLNESPNIDTVDETGKTALAVAMERGFEKAVEFLVNSGASVDLRRDHGRAILLHVTECSWHNAGKIIVERAASSTSNDDTLAVRNQLDFILATYHGKTDEVRRLANLGDFDLKSNDHATGEISLFLAVELEHMQMIQALLDVGVDVNAEDNTGQTALHRATSRKNEAMIRLLLSNRAAVDRKDDDGRTAWSANVQSRNAHILGLLLEAGADPSTRGLQGVSELYTAAKDGNSQLVKFMLQSGTDPSLQTEYYWAPLHWAASYGHLECVQLLIDAGADLSVMSDQSVTPLDLALRANQKEIADLLIRAGAKEGGDVTPRLNAVTMLGDSESDWIQVGDAPPLHPLYSEAGYTTSTTATPDTTPDTKLLLVFDKPLIRALVNHDMVGQFIYPRKSSGIAATPGCIYQISHVLEAPTACMSIRKSTHRAESREYPLPSGCFNQDDVLYDITRIRNDYQEFKLKGGKQARLAENIRMHRDWTGSWKTVRYSRQDDTGNKTIIPSTTASYLFRTTPDWSSRTTTTTQDNRNPNNATSDELRWITEEKKLLARSSWEDETPNLCFEAGVEGWMVDLVVACWVTGLWSETVVAGKRES
ncbi:MAG: hypothetical protein M1840_002216 [Geoglossum simile]|nr:MAG: hypothetical protein M1840_002216 [Geoglossum simile]